MIPKAILWTLMSLLIFTFTLPFLALLSFLLVLLALWWTLGATYGLAHYGSMKLDTPDTNLTLKQAMSYGLYRVYAAGYNACHKVKRKAPEYPNVFEVLRGF